MPLMRTTLRFALVSSFFTLCAGCVDGRNQGTADNTESLPTCDVEDAFLLEPGEAESPLQVIVGGFQAGLVTPEPLSTNCTSAFRSGGECLLELTSDCQVTFESVTSSTAPDAGVDEIVATIRLVSHTTPVEIFQIRSTSDCVDLRVRQGDTTLSLAESISLARREHVDLDIFPTSEGSCEAEIEVESDAYADWDSDGMRYFSLAWE